MILLQYPYPYIIVSVTFIGICWIGLKKLDRIIQLLERIEEKK